MAKELVVFTCLIFFAHGCLITNCPRGGKRGETVTALENVARECTSCGPNRMGQCFGPQICCGPSIGCFLGTPETFKCRKESLYSRPCVAGFAMCRGSTARCAANGICCSQESCFVDQTCKVSNVITGMQKADGDLGAILPENEISNEM
ncbi:hypothetical protein KM043_001221 [Ampulex compressa]|nr:hypothetical protein KM043_001221 [Ampulex compressa]